MLLKKVGGQWKVSVSDLSKGSSSENVQKTLASVDTAVAGYKSVLADLNAGKLPTVEAVGAELNAKMTAGGVTPPAAGAAGTPAAAPGSDAHAGRQRTGFRRTGRPARHRPIANRLAALPHAVVPRPLLQRSSSWQTN